MRPSARSFSRFLTPSAYLPLSWWDKLGTLLFNAVVLLILAAYLFPMLFMVTTAVKEDTQFTDTSSPLWPGRAKTVNYQGKTYPIYLVPTAEGVQHWILINPYRAYSEFIDPAHPEKGLIRWNGYWRQLKQEYTFGITLTNLQRVWSVMDFTRLLQNSLVITLLSEAGVLVSSILVAYGFSRFPIPGGKILFVLVIASIIMPEKATLIPTYYLFNKVFGWGGTLYPLVVPSLFGNAVLIFLLHQNFKTIPKEVDEAAMLDGAKPWRILVSIILPQCVPVVITAALLHFFYAWGEIRNASLYLASAPQLYPVSFGVQTYQRYFPPPNLVQMSALLAMAVPVLVLFASQGVFMKNVVVTGTEK